MRTTPHMTVRDQVPQAAKKQKVHHDVSAADVRTSMSYLLKSKIRVDAFEKTHSKAQRWEEEEQQKRKRKRKIGCSLGVPSRRGRGRCEAQEVPREEEEEAAATTATAQHPAATASSSNSNRMDFSNSNSCARNLQSLCSTDTIGCSLGVPSRSGSCLNNLGFIFRPQHTSAARELANNGAQNAKINASSISVISEPPGFHFQSKLGCVHKVATRPQTHIGRARKCQQRCAECEKQSLSMAHRAQRPSTTSHRQLVAWSSGMILA